MDRREIYDLSTRLRRTGLGAPIGVGGAVLSTPPAELAAQSPQLALARAMGVPFAPYLLNIAATFSDPNVATLNPSSFNQPGSITQPSIVDRLMFQIDCPSAFAGNVFKAEQDYFFGLQSGIQATLQVVGAPRYTVAPFFTPIRSLAAMINEAWPNGWVLGHTQNVVMQFQASIALPFLPTTVTVTFRLWQPYDNEFVQMTDSEARSQLAALAATMPPTPSGAGQQATNPQPAQLPPTGTQGSATPWVTNGG